MTFPNIGGTSGSLPAAPVVLVGADSSAKPPSNTATTPGVSSVRQTQDQAPVRLDGKQLESALDKLRQAVAASARDLNFSVDSASGKTVVRVVDQATGQLIRQIPSQEVLAMSESIGQMQGLLLKKQV